MIEIKNSILFEKLLLSCVSRIPDAAKVLIYKLISSFTSSFMLNWMFFGGSVGGLLFRCFSLQMYRVGEEGHFDELEDAVSMWSLT